MPRVPPLPAVAAGPGGAAAAGRLAALAITVLLLLLSFPAAAGSRPGGGDPVVLAHPAPDGAPPGVDVHRKPTTSQLLARARVAVAADGRAGVPAYGTAAAAPPPGQPAMPGLARHVPPSCTGTGSDGNRVQVVYAVEQGQPDRYAQVLPALQSFVADVDDTFAVSARETGGGRRVRWVEDANCVPVIAHVVLPAGSLGTNFYGSPGSTVDAMQAAGYNAPDRKYLIFADAAALCGIATVIGDSAPTGNANDGGYAEWARVDSSCWPVQPGWHSVAAHELMHTLGAVQTTAPHATAYNHCTDEYEVMCYADGSGAVMQPTCPSSHEPLYDCNHDDYFSTAPPAGNYLATHWNTASSSFLDTVPVMPPAPTVGLSGPATVTAGQPSSFTATPSSSSDTLSWLVSPSSCVAGPTDQPTLTVNCPNATAGAGLTVRVTATTPDGQYAQASRTASIVNPPAPPPPPPPAPSGPTAQVFTVSGGYGAVWHSVYQGGRLVSSQNLGGVAVGAAAWTSLGGTDLAVVVRGTDSAVWLRTYTGGSWSGWRSLGGTTWSPPGVTAMSGAVYAFARGTDNALWARSLSTGWGSLGGVIIAGPAATWAPGGLRVYALGGDHGVWTCSFGGGGWSGWSTIGGRSPYGPSAVTEPDGTPRVYVVGTDRAVWVHTGGWGPLGGAVIATPQPANTGPAQDQVFVTGTDGRLWTGSYGGSSWTGWSAASP